MTVGENPGFVSDDITERLQAWETRPIMPVHVVSQSGSWGKKIPPEFVGLNTWPVPQSLATGGSGQGYVQIGQRRYARSRMRIWIASISGTGTLTGQQEIVGSNPAPGADYIYTNNTNGYVQVISAFGQMTTDATVANRFLAYKILDSSGNRLAQAGDTTAQVASTVLNFSAYIGANQINTASGGPTVIPLPATLYIPPGGSFHLSGQDGASADQWSQITLVLSQGSDAAGTQIRIASDVPTLQNGGGIAIPSGLIPFGGGGGWSWESQRPCYATCDNGSGTVLTADESFADEPGDR